MNNRLVRLVELQVQRWLLSDEGKKVGGGTVSLTAVSTQTQHQPNVDTHATTVKKEK